MATHKDNLSRGVKTTVDFRFERSGEVGILTLNGELSLSCADNLMEVLMASLGNSEHLVIDLDRVNRFDQPCLHLLCVACRTSRKLRKRFTLTGKRTVCSGCVPGDLTCVSKNCTLTVQ